MDILQTRNKVLNAQIIVLFAVPFLFLIYLMTIGRGNAESVRDFLQKDLSMTIQMILYMTNVFSAYIIREYKNNRNRRTFIAYIIIFLTQLIQMNIIAVVLMFYYFYVFVGLKNIKSSLNSLDRGKGYLALCLSIAILITSIFLVYIKYMAI